MKLINQSASIIQYMTASSIELASRIYYSDDRCINDDAEAFIQRLIYNRHEAVLEHGFASVRFVTNRDALNEIRQYRLSSFTQENPRYVCYEENNLEFIRPVWLDNYDDAAKQAFISALESAEKAYSNLINAGWNAQDVFPAALKAEAVVTANYREWRHLFKVFVLGGPDKTCAQMRDLMVPLLHEFHDYLPALFADLV